MISQKFLKGEKDYPMTEESTIMALENFPEVIGRFLAIEKTKRKVRRAAKQITNLQNKEAAYTKLDRILTEEKLIKTECEKKIFNQLKEEKKDIKLAFKNSDELISFLEQWCDSLTIGEDYITKTTEKLEIIKNSKSQILQELSRLDGREIKLEELEKNFTKGSTLTNIERLQLNEEKESFLKDLEGIVYYKKEPMVYDELTHFVQNHLSFKLVRTTCFITRTIAKGTATFIKFILPIIEKEIRKKKGMKITETTIPKIAIPLPTKKDFTPKAIVTNLNIIAQALAEVIQQRRKVTTLTKKEEQKAEETGKKIMDMFTEEKVQKFTEKGVKIIR